MTVDPSEPQRGYRIYLCRIVTHDFFFFTRLGFGDTKTPEYIGNYALMYSLNRLIPLVQRNASGTKPYYTEDIPKFKIYATPATPAEQDRVFRIDGSSFNWRSAGKVMITYNSVNTVSNTTSYAKTDPRAKMNFPLLGRKERDPPLTCYQFYAIGGEPQQLVRLGKKMTAVRITSEPLFIQRHNDGGFEPSHPINPSDVSAEIIEGTLFPQFPPLILGAKMKGEHYICLDSHNKKHIVAMPKKDLYTGVDFPNVEIKT